MKCFWQSAYGCKTELVPKLDGAFIGRSNEIELHCFVSERSGNFLGMLAHDAGHSAPSRGGSDHVAAIADMIARAGLVGFDEIRSENSPMLFEYEGFSWRIEPNLLRLFYGGNKAICR